MHHNMHRAAHRPSPGRRSVSEDFFHFRFLLFKKYFLSGFVLMLLLFVVAVVAYTIFFLKFKFICFSLLNAAL